MNSKNRPEFGCSLIIEACVWASQDFYVLNPMPSFTNEVTTDTCKAWDIAIKIDLEYNTVSKINT